MGKSVGVQKRGGTGQKKRNAAQLLEEEADDGASETTEDSGDMDGDALKREFNLAEHWSVDIETATRVVDVVRTFIVFCF
jgi:hypothetical protein